MIDIKYENGTFGVKGSLDLGYLGKYTNETWKSYDDEDMISIVNYEGISEIIEDLNDYNPDGWGWSVLCKYLKKDEYSHKKITQAMECYFNKQEEKIQKNIKQFNDNLLSFIFCQLCGTSYPFWEDSNTILSERMPQGYQHECKEALEKIIYGSTAQLFQELYYEYFDGIPNDGTINKPDIESLIYSNFPMFNLDGLVAKIIPGSITLSGDSIDFQCDDGWGSRILCAAYAEIRRDLSFNDWHNH